MRERVPLIADPLTALIALLPVQLGRTKTTKLANITAWTAAFISIQNIRLTTT